MKPEQFTPMSSPEAFGFWRLCIVTPADAEALLAGMGRNRVATDGRVRMYSRSIQQGQWLVTHQGMAVHDGQLVDGQNRCLAIIASNTPVCVWIYFSSGSQYMREIDRQQPRSDYQVAMIAGVDGPAWEVRAARVIAQGRRAFDSRQKLATHDILQCVEKAASAVAWLRTVGFQAQKPGLSITPIAGAIGRAWMIYGGERCDRFMDIYMNGAAFVPSESAAMRLHDLALSSAGARMTHRLDQYLKAASAIKAFMSGKPLAKLYATESPEEPLPLPGEATK